MSRLPADAAMPSPRSNSRWRPVDLGPLDIVVEAARDGTIYARSPFELAPYELNVTRWLDHWAAQAPDRVFLAERRRDGRRDWATVTYRETQTRARALGAALLARSLSAERPLLILSGNSIAHALLGLAALYVGIPYAPIATAASLGSNDFTRLKTIVHALTPGLVFADDGALYADALAALPAEIPRLVCSTGTQNSNVESFDDWLSTKETTAFESARVDVEPHTIAKFMFTSGSTAAPKAVVTTHKMLCVNQAMIAHAMRFLKHEPPALLDWLPWSHSFGGNQNFDLVLAHGGTLYIDDGRPTTDGIAATLNNIRDVSPTLHFNVPAGLEILLPHLARDQKLAKAFFRDLRLTFFAGAPIARATCDAWNDLARASSGENILTMSGYGATESGPATTFWTPFIDAHVGVGLPLPGCELKLTARVEKREVRVKGPHVTPGYWRNREATEKAFDDEGFFSLGDALRFADERTPRKGFCFDGRTSEDFKLASGTWVSAGPLREAVLAALAPYAKDLVLAGDGASFVAALVFADFQACEKLSGAGTPATIVSHSAVRAKFQTLLDGFAAGRTPSRRVARLLLLAAPPAADETTDKRGLDRAAILARRETEIAGLFSATPPAQVIVATAS
jgi:feruloyl-CoA synthase